MVHNFVLELHISGLFPSLKKAEDEHRWKAVIKEAKVHKGLQIRRIYVTLSSFPIEKCRYLTGTLGVILTSHSIPLYVKIPKY
jgi:hypothetical protein